jgi:4-amino-4-deoxy-L-arabinose transferase-like glycosyltransferase
MTRFGWLALALVAYQLGWGIAGALNKRIWHDEIFTIVIARGPDWATVLSHAGSGIDLQPPLTYLTTRLMDPLPGPEELRLRAPSLLGMTAFLLSLWWFVRRRGSEAAALGAVAIPCLSSFWHYSYDLRPYGLMLGFGGLALAAWQEAGVRRGWQPLVLLGVASTCATLNHYYGVLIPFCLGLAELARWRRTRRWDWGVWMVLAGSGVSLAWPLAHWGNLHRYSGHFWGQGYRGLTAAYLNLGSAAVVMAVAGVASRVLRSRSGQSGWPLEERVLAAVLALVPVWGWVISKGTGAGLGFYYCNMVVAGAALGFAWWLQRQEKAVVGALVAFVAAVVVVPTHLSRAPWWVMSGNRTAALWTVNLPAAQARWPGLPVYLEGPQEFLESVYQHRGNGGLVYAADAGQSVRYQNFDTTELAFAGLATIYPLPLERWSDFKAPSLVVAGKLGWLRQALRDSGYRIEVAEPGGEVYYVTR